MSTSHLLSPLVLASLFMMGCAVTPEGRESEEGTSADHENSVITVSTTPPTLNLPLSNPEVAPLSRADTLTVVTYNLWMKPGCWGLAPDCDSPSKVERAQRILEKIDAMGSERPDVFVFQEGFDGDAVGEGSCDPTRSGTQCTGSQGVLKQGLYNRGYGYITANTDRGSSLNSDGGVFIASRYPWDGGWADVGYSTCAGTDCYANKGVMYVPILKDGRKYHVFGTHTDATSDVVRAQQFTEISNFISSRNILNGEPILIAGDLNTDRWSTEYSTLLRNTGAEEPKRYWTEITGQDKAHPFSDDEAIDNAVPPNPTNRKWLDYVLSKPNGGGVELSNTAFLLRATWGGVSDHDLSDHFPVKSTVRSHGGPPLSVSLRSGSRCIDVPGSSTTPGIALQTFGCHGGKNQQWLPRFIGIGVYELRNVQTNLCLADSGTGSPTQQVCSRAAAQQWRFDGGTDGSVAQIGRSFTVRNVGSGRRLLETGTFALSATTGSGTTFQAWTEQIEPITPFTLSQGAFKVGAVDGRCLDVPSAVTTDVHLQTYSCHGGENQRWLFTAKGNNAFELRRKSTSLCVDAQGYQRACNDSAGQQFYVRRRADNLFDLVSRSTGQCLASNTLTTAACDPTGANTAQGWTLMYVK